MTMMNPGDPDPSHSELGPMQEEFRVLAWRPVAVGGGCFLTVLAGVVGAVLLPLATPAEGLETKEDLAAMAVGLWIFAGVCAVMLALIVRKTLRQRRVRLRLHERGFLFHDETRRTQVFLWDEIASFLAEVSSVTAHGLVTTTFRKYTLHKATGETLRLAWNVEIRDIERVADRIAEETLRRLLPRALATVEGGGMVPFGDWTVTREHLASGPDARLPWDEVRDIEAREGVIVVREHGRRFGSWARMAYGKMPNAHVFLPLADALRG